MQMKSFLRISKPFIMLFGLLMTGILVCIQQPICAQIPEKVVVNPQPRVIAFDPTMINYQELLSGPEDSVVFYSGVVTLTPGQYGDLHSTEIYEEIIIALEGQGQLMITDRGALILKFGTVGFVPPETHHQMVNDGTVNFKYIYVATKSIK